MELLLLRLRWCIVSTPVVVSWCWKWWNMFVEKNACNELRSSWNFLLLVSFTTVECHLMKASTVSSLVLAPKPTCVTWSIDHHVFSRQNMPILEWWYWTFDDHNIIYWLSQQIFPCRHAHKILSFICSWICLLASYVSFFSSSLFPCSWRGNVEWVLSKEQH